MMNSNRTDEFAVNVDCKGRGIWNVVELVPDHFLFYDWNQIFSPVSLVAQTVDWIELIFRIHASIPDAL